MVYERALQIARVLFSVGSANGHKFDVLNIGGGFPGVQVKDYNDFHKVK